jgi:peptidyl-prolyl cis-trans isomerase C
MRRSCSRPSPFARRAAALGIFAVVAAAPPPARLEAAPSPVVAKVGAVTITAADIERRMAAVPPFQLRTFGATPAEIRREFVERVLVREALLAQGAAAQGLENRDDIKERVRGLLRNAFLGRLRNEVVTSSRVDDAEIKAFYEKNASRFHTPERYALWMIATSRREEAVEILADLHKDPSPKHWAEVARAKSIDGATALRGGNLGFVSPDGTTPEPGLKVSHAVIEVAQKLKDAEIAADPVKDGDRWVIVWRKQTMAAVERSVDVEAGSIKQLLLHTRTEAKVKETIAALRKQHLTEHNPDLADLFDITPQGDLTPVRRPGSLPAGRHVAATPVPTPGTLR